MKKFTNDHRAKVTQMLIRKAFTELLKQKPIQNISIRELCERAGINRGTFYAHYLDIYDLRDSLENEMFEKFDQALKDQLAANKGSVSPVRVTAELFQCLKDHSDLCVVTLGEYGDKNFLLKLVTRARQIGMESYAKYFTDVPPQKIDYFYAYISSGCMGLVQKWIEDGMTVPVSEMSSMTQDMIVQGIRFLK